MFTLLQEKLDLADITKIVADFSPIKTVKHAWKPDPFAKQLRWWPTKGRPAGTINLVLIHYLSSKEDQIVLGPGHLNRIKLSSSEMRFVEAVWRELGPDGFRWVLDKDGEGEGEALMFFVNGYLYIVDVDGGLPFVIACQGPGEVPSPDGRGDLREH